VERAAGIGSYLLEVAGFTSASGSTRFLFALKNLAANKDEANLMYFGEALLDDIRRLYRLHEELREQFDERLETPEFNVAVANATLHITRTNVESRLKRLAHLLANGVKENDLEPESLDDMMRAAVELSELDIHLLKELCEHNSNEPLDMNESDKGRTDSAERMGAVAKLQAVAFVQLRTPGTDLGADIVVLLPRGKKFFERLQEITE
jgi:hypothetical protein